MDARLEAFADRLMLTPMQSADLIAGDWPDLGPVPRIGLFPIEGHHVFAGEAGLVSRDVLASRLTPPR
jgi:hypothetical protein